MALRLKKNGIEYARCFALWDGFCHECPYAKECKIIAVYPKSLEAEEEK